MVANTASACILPQRQFPLNRARHPRLALAHEDVHFGANSEGGQVYARLYREARPRCDAALVVRFQVVHVGAVSVDLDANGVSRPMREILPVPATLNHTAR